MEARLNQWAKRLRAWRVKLDLKQKEAADRLNVNLRTFQGWEEGKSEPHPLAKAELERRMGEVKD